MNEASRGGGMEAALDGKDSDQTSMMSESCILVDNEDVAIGSLSPSLSPTTWQEDYTGPSPCSCSTPRTSCSSRSVPRARSPSHPCGPTAVAATH